MSTFGIREARVEFVLLMDADGQHDPDDVLRLLEPLDVHDLVIGARASKDQTATRALGNWVFTWLASWLTGRPIPDLTSGFRAARRERLLEILHLLPNGFSYPTTSCLALLKAGHNVTFVPIRAHRRVGKSKIRVLQDGTKFLLIILKIVTLYSPLKVFFPIAASAFLLGAVYGLWNVLAHGKIPMGSALLIQLAVVVFLFGLISEQIAMSFSAAAPRPWSPGTASPPTGRDRGAGHEAGSSPPPDPRRSAGRGAAWRSRLRLYQYVGEGALAYQVEVKGETGVDVPVETYGALVIYRRPMFRPWLFLEARTGVSWPRKTLEETRQINPGIGLGFEYAVR